MLRFTYSLAILMECVPCYTSSGLYQTRPKTWEAVSSMLPDAIHFSDRPGHGLAGMPRSLYGRGRPAEHRISHCVFLAICIAQKAPSYLTTTTSRGGTDPTTSQRSVMRTQLCVAFSSHRNLSGVSESIYCTNRIGVFNVGKTKFL